MSQEQNQATRRPPIVVVMGHIDHGKTTLLDTIRESNVAGNESGGITQHIGAYEVVRGDKKITFLDTPGHEAFTQMRARGATVADIAILIVAADDGIKPQTKEALATILSAGIPYCVAINKIDKPNADAERVRHELANEGVYLEGRGGTIPAVEISAKEGTHIDQLLETVLILSELEDLSCNVRGFAEGVVIESHRDPKRGNTSTLLITNGTLKKGEYVVAGSSLAKTRIMENHLGVGVESAGPSVPVVVVSFDSLPAVGLSIQSFFSQKDAIAYQRKMLDESKKKEDSEKLKSVILRTPEEAKREIVIALVVKGDTEGSVEAILHEVKKIAGEGFQIKILRSLAGDVSMDDVGLAASGERAAVIAFKVKISGDAKDLAEKQGVTIGVSDIIYEIPTFLKTMIENVLPPLVERTEVGKLKILKLFKSEGKTQVIGGRVTVGVLRKECRFAIVRREAVIGEGAIENVQSGKANVSEVTEKQECGALVRPSVSLVVDDVLVLFEEKVTKRLL